MVMVEHTLADRSTTPGAVAPVQAILTVDQATWAALRAEDWPRGEVAARTPGGGGEAEAASAGDLGPGAGSSGDVLPRLAGVPAVTDETGQAWPASEIARALCDCSLTRAVIGAESETLDLGRDSRLFKRRHWLALYAAGVDGNSQGRIVIKDNGAISLYTTDTNKKDGTAVFLRIAPDGFEFVAPWGSLKFDATGFFVKTKTGERIEMGPIQIPGIPAELTSVFGGYCKITAPMVKVNSGSIYLGAGEVFQPVVYGVLDPSSPPPAPLLIGKSIQSQTVWVSI